MTSPTAPPSGAKPTAKDVRDAVTAYARVPAAQQPQYRARVIAMARAAGAIAVIPEAWLSGHPGRPANPDGRGNRS